uniref:Calcineurin-binding protein cabin-1 MEF2-binding domain-containing protein n=1 Tax=Eptatretus burgeri TaxID=7764 RepID=A0A8C4QQ52_EPTBU
MTSQGSLQPRTSPPSKTRNELLGRTTRLAKSAHRSSAEHTFSPKVAENRYSSRSPPDDRMDTDGPQPGTKEFRVGNWVRKRGNEPKTISELQLHELRISGSRGELEPPLMAVARKRKRAEAGGMESTRLDNTWRGHHGVLTRQIPYERPAAAHKLLVKLHRESRSWSPNLERNPNTNLASYSERRDDPWPNLQTPDPCWDDGPVDLKTRKSSSEGLDAVSQAAQTGSDWTRVRSIGPIPKLVLPSAGSDPPPEIMITPPTPTMHTPGGGTISEETKQRLKSAILSSQSAATVRTGHVDQTSFGPPEMPALSSLESSDSDSDSGDGEDDSLSKGVS